MSELKVGDYIMWDRESIPGRPILENYWEGGYGPHHILRIEDGFGVYVYGDRGEIGYVSSDGGGYTIVPPPEPDDVRAIDLKDRPTKDTSTGVPDSSFSCMACLGTGKCSRCDAQSPNPDDVSFTTLDSLGESMGMDMTQHPTGALRESKEGKGKPHLLLCGFPRALMALSRHVDCELGRERNWEKGLPESSLIDSQFRHLMGYTSGNSEDSPEYNLTANLWNSIVLLEEYLRVKDGVMEREVLDVRKGDNE